MSKYSKLKKEIISNYNYSKNNSNNSTININIDSTGDIISHYSEDNKVVINNEFANFLENSVKDVSVKQSLTLKISASNCDLNKISTSIKNYYFNEFIDYQRKLKNNIIFSLTTFLIGLLALASSILLATFDTPLIIGGAIDIFAWVFMWESVDLFFFKRNELKYQQYRYINFINAKIILNNKKTSHNN